LNDNKYKAKALDAHYDTELQVLILTCWLDEIQEKRIIHMPKSDFTFKGNAEVPDEEMTKTAELWKGKWFYIDIQDDPSREEITAENQEEVFDTFKKEIASIVDQTNENLVSEEKQIEKKIKDLLNKEDATEKAKKAFFGDSR